MSYKIDDVPDKVIEASNRFAGEKCDIGSALRLAKTNEDARQILGMAKETYSQLYYAFEAGAMFVVQGMKLPEPVKGKPGRSRFCMEEVEDGKNIEARD